MQFYMAPMEGITGYIYRAAYHKSFGNIDRYFAPFIMSRRLNQKEIRDILPENNEGMELIPQILTNRAEDFLAIAKEIRQYGYDKVNLNLGCPSPTVTSRNRGSGFLAFPRELDRFLEEIFEKYPLEELIIHPRLKTDQYKKNTIHWEAFKKAEESSRHSLCYNGDIVSKDDYEKVVQRFPGTEKIMIGRGILKKPWLAEEISNGDKKDSSRYKEELFEFHEELLKGYMDYMSGDRNTLYKMKELWAYLGTSFTNPERYMKKIRKSQHISEYRIWVGNLFREQDLIW